MIAHNVIASNESRNPEAFAGKRQPSGVGGSETELVRTHAVVLSGTLQWGGCPLDDASPRPLLPVANRPLIDHALRWLCDGGIRSATICANSHTDAIERVLNGLLPVKLEVDYWEDVAPRGPAGCVRDASQGLDCAHLVVVESAVIPQVDLKKLLAAHVETGAALTVVLAGDGLCTGSEMDGQSLRPTGVYVFDKRALERVPDAGYQDIKEGLVPNLYARGELVAPYRSEGPAVRVTEAESYLAVNSWMLRRIAADSIGYESFGRVGEALIHPTASVDGSAQIIGPVLVGADSSIGRGVSIIGPTSIGDGCEIAKDALVMRSSIWHNCSVGQSSVLDRCIMTAGAAAAAEEAYRNVVLHRRRPSRLTGLLGRWMTPTHSTSRTDRPAELHIART